MEKEWLRKKNPDKIHVNCQLNRGNMVLMVLSDEQPWPYISPPPEHNEGLGLEDKPQWHYLKVLWGTFLYVEQNI